MAIKNIIITVLALSARMALSMQNVLNGCQTAVSPPWSSQANEATDRQNSAMSAFLNDDVNLDSKGNQPETCTAPNSQARDGLSFMISCSSPQSARSFVFVLGLTTQSKQDSAILTYYIRYNQGTVMSGTSNKLSKVHYSATALTFDQIFIEMIAPSNGFQLCFDEIFALKAHYLNPKLVQISEEYIAAASSGLNNTYNTRAPFQTNVVNNPFKDQWDLNNCWLSRNISEIYPNSWGHINLQARFTLNHTLANSRLLTGQLVQYSPNQPFVGTSRICPRKFDWIDSLGSFNTIGNYNCEEWRGNKFASYQEQTYGSPLVSLSRINLFHPEATMNICSFQLFGYNSCVFQVIPTSTISRTLAIGLTEFLEYTESYIFGSYIEDAGASSNNITFCSFGTNIYQECTQCPSGEILPFQAIPDFDINKVIIKSNSTLDAIFDSKVYTVRFHIYDIRDGPFTPNDKSVFQEYKFTFLPGCKADELKKLTVVKAGTTDPLSDITVTARKQEKVISYDWYNQPTCRGFTDKSCESCGITDTRLQLIDQEGQNLLASYTQSSWQEYSECTLKGQEFCAYKNPIEKKIYLWFDNEIGIGTNTLYLLPEITALSGSFEGDTLTIQYYKPDSFSPRIQVTYTIDSYCSLPGLSNTQVVDKDTLLAPEDIIGAYLDDQEKTIQFELINLQNCPNFLPNRAQFTARIENEQQQFDYYFLTNSQADELCPSQGFCGRITFTNGQGTISILINSDTRVLGTNQITISHTIYGFQTTGSVISGQGASTQFQLQVIKNECTEDDFTATQMLAADTNLDMGIKSVWWGHTAEHSMYISNEPDCEFTVTFITSLVAADSTTVNYGTSVDAYDDCVTGNDSLCLFQSTSSDSLQLKQYVGQGVTSFLGTYTVRVQPTFTYTILNRMQTATYTLSQEEMSAQKFEFTLIVDIDNRLCITSTFASFEYTTDQYWQSGLYSPQFRVKQYQMVDQSYEMADVNFVTTAWQVQTQDSVSSSVSDGEFCGEYQFDIALQSGVNEFATVLLHDITGYQATQIQAQALFDELENQVGQFEIQVRMLKYTQLGLADSVQPVLSGTFKVTVDECLVTVVKALSSDLVRILVYSIGQEESLVLTYTAQRLANCNTAGAWTFYVNGIASDRMSLSDKYGILVSTQLSANFETEKVDLTISTSDASLAGQMITLQVKYEVDGISYTFKDAFLEYLIPIDNCSVGALTFSTGETVQKEYEIGSNAVKAVFITVQKEETCDKQGQITFQVGATSNNEVTETYGISVGQTTDTEGKKVLITVFISTSDTDLIGSTITMEMNYIVEEEIYQLPNVIVTYTEFESKSLSTSDATTLSKTLGAPLPIPCLESSSDWAYEVPQSLDPENTHYSFSCDTLSILQFNNLLVSVDQEATDQPKTDTYPCNLTLYDITKSTWEESSSKESYDVQLYVFCDQENAGYDQKEDSAQFGPEFGDLNNENLGKIIYPVPEIDKIDFYGRIFIRWNQKMAIKSHYNSTRRLQTFNQSSEEVRITYHQNSDDEYVYNEFLAFNLTFEWQDSRTYVVKLDFARPEYVSADSRTPDLVQIDFTISSGFKSEAGVSMQQEITLVQAFPKQYPKEGAISINKEAVEASTKVIFVSSFIMSYFWKLVLNQLLGVIDNLQIITHMFLLSLEYPANVQEFFGGLFPLVTFDIISIELILEWFNLDYDHVEMAALSTQFENVGYETTFIILNMGSLFFVLLFKPIVTLILWLVRKNPFLSQCTRMNRKIDQYLRGQFWNSTILLFDSAYLVIAMASQIGLQDLRLDRDKYIVEEWGQSWLSIVFAIGCIAFPIAILCTHCKHIKGSKVLPDLKPEMTEEERTQIYGYSDVNKIRKKAYTETKHQQFLAKYGVLIQEYNLNTLGKSGTIAMIIVQLARRYLFVVSIIKLLHSPFFSIFCLYLNFIAGIIVSGWTSPFGTKQANRIKLANESIFLFCIYLLLGFTEFNNEDTKQIMGNWTIIFVTGESLCFVALHAYIFLKTNFLQLRLKYRKRRAQQRYWKKCIQKIKQDQEAKETLEKSKIATKKEEAFKKAQLDQTSNDWSFNINKSFSARPDQDKPSMMDDSFANWGLKRAPNVAPTQIKRRLDSIQSAGSEEEEQSSRQKYQTVIIWDQFGYGTISEA